MKRNADIQCPIDSTGNAVAEIADIGKSPRFDRFALPANGG
jgi:hypothetical protein